MSIGFVALAATLASAPVSAGESKVDEAVSQIVSIAGDPAFGAYLGGECVTCHRPEGSAGIPRIAGLPAEAFVRALVEYRLGLRENEVMRTTASRLKDDEIAALAAHFSAQ